jgi:autotransporter-associated beta strand protein
MRFPAFKLSTLPLLLLLAVPAAQAAPWTPANLPSDQLKNWYDAADLTTLWQNTGATTPVTATGQTVLRWNDKSANGNHLTVGSGGPAYTAAAMNALPVLRFNGNSMSNLTATMGSSTDNFTVIGVFKVASNTGWDNWVDWGPASGYSGLVFVASGARPGGPAQSMEISYGGGIGENTDVAVTGQAAYLFAGAANQSVSPTLDSVWMNGTSQGARNPDTYTAPSGPVTHINIGIPSQVPHGDIAEFIVVNTGAGTLADTTRQLVEGYLANKWWGAGANNPLPGDHPYKNSAPVYQNQTWAANVNSNWDTTTANWSGSVWTNGNSAIFGSVGVGTVNLGAGLTANSITFNTAGYTLAGGTLGLTGTAAITANADATIAAALSGSQGLAFAGTGTLVLSGANTYSGATSINAGTLWFGVNHNSLGAVTLANVAGARLALNYTNSLLGMTIGSLSGGGATGGNVDLRGDTLTVGGDNTSTTFAGQIASSGGGGNLVKTGTGTLTLAGSNTYTGTTTVSQGTLVMGGTAGPGTLTVAPGAGLGNVGQLNLSGNLVLGDGCYLNLNLASAGAADGIRLSGGYAAPGSAVKININALGGFGAGTYNLITGAAGIRASSFILNSVPPGYVLGLTASNGTLVLTCAQNPPVRILPLGDSITWGVGGDANLGGYRSALYTSLTALGYNVNFIGNSIENSSLMAQPHHEGHPGITIGQIASNIAGWLATVDNPDVVLLHIGTNDLGSGDFPNAINRLDDLITQIATLRPYAHIIVTNLMERGAPQILTDFNPYVQAKVNAQAALGRRVSFLDMHAAVPYPANMADGLHPNQTGYNLMAAAWLGAIQAVQTPQGAVSLLPAAPVGLTAAAGNARVVLSWSAPPSATGYNVKRSTVSGSGYVTIASNTSATGFTDTGVTNGTTYYYVVSAINGIGEGADSSQSAAQPVLAQAHPWTPALLASAQLKNWYDASDVTTLWQNPGATTPVNAGGQTVLRVNDKSVNGNNLTANTGGPTYTAGAMNSLPVLRFSGGTLTNLAASMGSISDNFTVIGVFKVVGNSGWDNWISWGNGSVGGGDPVVFVTSGARTGGPSNAMEFAYSGGEGEATDTAVMGQPALLFVGGLNQTASPSLFSVWMNGASQGARNPTPAYTATHSSSLTQFRIGQANSQQPHGDIAELIVLNTGTNTLSDADRQKIEGYLANKWWGAGSNNPLAADHPYKNSAPADDSQSWVVPISEAELHTSSTIHVSGNTVTLTFAASVVGHTYQLQTSDSLADGTWTDYGPPQPGTGSALIFTAPYNNSIPRRFCRLWIQQ